MPVTQTSPFPVSTQASASVLALRANQKAAFDKVVDEMVKLVGTRFVETLAKPKPGEITHVPDEKRFEVKYQVPVEDLWRVAGGLLQAAKTEFTDLSEDGLRELIRNAVVQNTATSLKAQEYTNIDVALAEKTEQRFSQATRANENVVVHVVHVAASCPDQT